MSKRVAQKTKPKTKTVSKQKSKPKAEVAIETVQEPEVVIEIESVDNEVDNEVETEVDNEVETVSKKTHSVKNVITIEDLNAQYDNLLQKIEDEILKLKETTSKQKGIKFLRSVGKDLKMLKRKTQTLSKKKRVVNRKTNANSGILKKVSISKDMAKFAGWNEDDKCSRVDVTKYICNYIKENNLQNPSDRRQIIPDSKLQKLLKFNPKKTTEPLRYYSLQTYLTQHFPK